MNGSGFFAFSILTLSIRVQQKFNNVVDFYHSYMLLVSIVNFLIRIVSCVSDVKDLLNNFIDTLSSEINEVIELPQNVSELFLPDTCCCRKK